MINETILKEEVFMRLRNCAMMALAVAGAMMLTACGGGSGTAASQAAGGNGGASASEQTFNQKEGLIPRSLLRNKLFQDMEEVIY